MTNHGPTPARPSSLVNRQQSACPAEGAHSTRSPTFVVRVRQPEELEDPLTDPLRWALDLAQAWSWKPRRSWLECTISTSLDGRDRLVRHGHGPERMRASGRAGTAAQPARCGRGRGRGDAAAKDAGLGGSSGARGSSGAVT